MKKGFTLLELIVVIIVIGILASIALPKFLEVAERGRVAEGLNILQSLRSAQLRYRAGATPPAYTAVVGDLDTTFTSIKYFVTPVSALAAAADTNSCASVTRNGTDLPSGWAAYTLCISPNGVIACDGTACPKIGYADGVCPQ